ncbi:uncharacterized protein LOC111601318 [Drosophila hydei]|uniref:Uncharacterized protein LOC111601318 n=1 Tax=Drosophila hydei TaxID=7224 RepID=A0A6J1M5N6_DROHY|nr:uncharacterized protein LOC111601318 [Drosophila hydei]
MSQSPEENHVHNYFAPTTLLFYFNELWELWNTISCHLITYIERGRGEYFAGFCSFHFCWHSIEEEEEEQEEQQLEQLEYNIDNGSSLEQDVDYDVEQRQQNLYHLVHMSLIFRASHFNQS